METVYQYTFHFSSHIKLSLDDYPQAEEIVEDSTLIISCSGNNFNEAYRYAHSLMVSYCIDKGIPSYQYDLVSYGKFPYNSQK